MRTMRVSPRRRGVLLLIVMALLGMFAMMAVSFIVITSQSRRSAEAFRDVEESDVRPQEELERAFAQVVRGSNNPASVIGAHSLLEDLYGNNAKLGQINDIAPPQLNIPKGLIRNEVWSTPENRLGGWAPGTNDSRRFGWNRPLLEIAVRPPDPNNQPPYPGSGTLDPRYNSVLFPAILKGKPMVVGATPIMPPLALDANGQVALGLVPTLNGAIEDYRLATECAGCVLTMLNGPAAGVSTRIVAVLPYEYRGTPSTTNPDQRPYPIINPAYNVRLQILAKDELNYNTLSAYFNSTNSRDGNGNQLAPPLRYIINGAPFSGTGNGLNSVAGKLQVDEMALVPNLRDVTAFSRQPTLSFPNQPTSTQQLNGSQTLPIPFYGPLGGANEDYDAPDHQNMLLAMVRPPARVPRPINAYPFDWVTTVPIPSMHRADLYQYWYAKTAVDPRQVVQYTMRPLQDSGIDANFQLSGHPIHPRFTGSNPKFFPGWDGTFVPDPRNPTQCKYQWDVDNDGDGIPDSVWVDLGMPVRTLRDGRRCKPLFAILCTDLDGRLNLNAHGTAEHLRPRTVDLSTPLKVTSRYAGDRDVIDVQRGQGYGPAEINLRAVLGPQLSTSNGFPDPTRDPYVRLLRGLDLTTARALIQAKKLTDVQQIEGRYGDLEYLLDSRINAAGTGAFSTLRDGPVPDYPTPGFPGERSPIMANRNTAYLPQGGMQDPKVLQLIPCPWGIPPYYTTNTQFATNLLFKDAYGTPPNLNGNCALALDRTGHPYYWGFAQGLGGRGDLEDTINVDRDYACNTPYELNLYQGTTRRVLPHLDTYRNPFAGSATIYTALAANASPQVMNSLPFATDAPFTPGELERVLRPFDVDSTKLAARIMNLTDPGWPATFDPTRSALLARRNEVTTESWDLPCPPAIIPSNLYGAGMPSEGKNTYGGNPIMRRLKVILETNTTTAAIAANPQTFLTLAYRLFAPETVAGLRMNLNRSFGNARDDNGNGTVDEPIEGKPPAPVTGKTKVTSSTEWQASYNPALLEPPLPAVGDAGNIDPANGYAVTGSSQLMPFSGSPGQWENKVQARQLYARNLYCLAYLLFANDQGRVPSAKCRELAQWAANVVDFLDRDSIMTRFDYDVSPFDGWNAPIDGSQTVFGVERPELLITETLALHDRRAEDSTNEVDPVTKADFSVGKGGGDGNLDQHFRPQGSLFVELYNPGSGIEPRPPELTAGSTTTNIRLDQVTPKWPNSPASVVYGSPVWRMLIVVPFPDSELLGFLKSGKQIGTVGDTASLVERLKEKKVTGAGAGGGGAGVWYRTERYVYFVGKAVVDELAKIDINEAPTNQNERATYWRGYAGSTALPSAVSIPPGQYAVVGSGEPYEYTSTTPKAVTYLGFRVDDQTKLHPDGRTHYFKPDPNTSNQIPECKFWRRIVLDQANNRVQVYNRPAKLAAGAVLGTTPSPADDLDTVSGQILSRGIPVIVSQPRRLNITEPCLGYENAGGVNQNAGGLQFGAPEYMWLVNPKGNKKAPDFDALDKPFDSVDNTYWSDPRKDMPGLLAAVYPKIEPKTERFRIVYLQRLADPTRPYNGNVSAVNPASVNPYNPYLTVDAMPVDLLAFNGADPEPNITPSALPVYTDERGESYPAAAAARGDERERLLWGQEPLSADPADDTRGFRVGCRSSARTNAAGPADAAYYNDFHFKNVFEHTLAYMNRSYGPLPVAPSTLKGYPDDRKMPDGDAVNADFATFPWLAWNNRPFISQLELLQVPRGSSDQILAYPYTNLRADPGLSPFYNATEIDNSSTPLVNPYAEGPGGMANTNAMPFRRLAPFFYYQPTSANTLPYHRLLDYVHVPSRFNGAEMQLRADAMATPTTTGNAQRAATHFFHTPFNWVSAYREPGRVNLNTIFSFDVWRGLTNDAHSMDGVINSNVNSALAVELRKTAISLEGSIDVTKYPDKANVNLDVMAMWRKLVLSRKGYWMGQKGNWNEAADPRTNPSDLLKIAPPVPTSDGAVIDQMLAIDPTLPTRFGNPFRSAGGFGFKTPIPSPAQASSTKQLPLDREVQATLLRPDPDSLFMARSPTAGPTSNCVPIFGFYSRKNYNNSQRNPTFAYQTLQRLGNLATTRSNVYAVWITMGYFEVEKITDEVLSKYKGQIQPDPLVYPDGCLLGQEVGYDSGEIKRYRSFYLFDRSIPVGFSRGEDVNFDKALLLHRFIE